VIELVSAERCIGCDKCIAVCPTNVFDRGVGGVPVISRHGYCQTCFQCEANGPVDALFVSPYTEPQHPVDERVLFARGLLGSYRERIGWGSQLLAE
jgi:NAD-dependent dihydropyrimidine dehydrogenase PreA subunit